MSTSNLLHLRLEVARRVCAASPATVTLDRMGNAPDVLGELRRLVAAPRFVDHATAVRIAAAARVELATLFEEV